MAKFECNWCGKCCEGFGEYITIERQMSDRDYYCRFGITNEIFPVHVQPEFADEIGDDFMDMDPKAAKPPHKGCIFSRKNPAGQGFACAIYPDRPDICREFQCYRMLIQNLIGEIKGRVIGINELMTKDQVLAAIWKEKIAHLPHPFNEEHGSKIPGNPSVHGHESHIFAHLFELGHGDDGEWEATVISILAAHGYRVEPVTK